MAPGVQDLAAGQRRHQPHPEAGVTQFTAPTCLIIGLAAQLCECCPEVRRGSHARRVGAEPERGRQTACVGPPTGLCGPGGPFFWGHGRRSGQGVSRAYGTYVLRRHEIRRPSGCLTRARPGTRGGQARRDRWVGGDVVVMWLLFAEKWGARECSLEQGFPSGEVERVKGVEPSWPAWKAGALPLCYTRPGGAREAHYRGGGGEIKAGRRAGPAVC